MKAVLLMRDCVLPGKATEVTGDASRAGLRALAQSELLTILVGVPAESPAPSAAAATRAASAIEGGGGRVDAVVWCPHSAGYGCSCWGIHPGLILEAESRFSLQGGDCYLIAMTPDDVVMAAAAGVRPILVLNGRSIGEVLGDSCENKDYPIARTLAQAVEYILSEERITAQLGRPRQLVPSTLAEESRPLSGTPVITPISRRAAAVTRRIRLRPREASRWLSLFVVGGVWLSLGIAYLLTHLYREQPFPAVFWYLTLQFIPRVVRGVLFILTGVAVVFMASRSFWHAFGNGNGQQARRG